MGAASELARKGRCGEDDLAELARLSQAQRDAATAGRFDDVRVLLGARRGLLRRLQGQAVRAADIEAVRAADAETRAALHAEIRRVETELGRLTIGSRALSGYAVRAATLPGFVDHIR